MGRKENSRFATGMEGLGTSNFRNSDSVCKVCGVRSSAKHLEWDASFRRGTLGTLQSIQSREDRGELRLECGDLSLLGLELSIDLLESRCRDGPN